MNVTRTAVINGRPVLVKRCSACGVEKVADVDRAVSCFYYRAKTGYFSGRCKECLKLEQRERYARYTPEQVTAINRAKHARRKADPERMGAFRARETEAARRRRRNATDEQRRRRSEIQRRWRERKLREDPDYFSRAAVAARRAAKLAAKRPVKVPTFEAHTFRRWLEEYSRESGIEVGAPLAFDLGINPRRLTAIFNEGAENVSVDVVDRALINANRVVRMRVNGDEHASWIFGIGDLYPHGIEREGVG